MMRVCLAFWGVYLLFFRVFRATTLVLLCRRGMLFMARRLILFACLMKQVDCFCFGFSAARGDFWYNGGNFLLGGSYAWQEERAYGESGD